MGQEEEAPQAKRARFADSPLQQQVARSSTPVGSSGLASSCTTGTTTAPVPATSQLQPTAKHAAPIPSSVTAATSLTKPAAKPVSNFIADAREAVRFRAVAAPSEQALSAEIASGGTHVSVDFLHQHFGDSEQIRGYSNLKVTIWIHVRTYHCWVDIVYDAKRPGADKLSDIFDGGFPCGYCKSKEEFVAATVSTCSSLSNLLTLGHCVGKMTLPASAFALRSAPAASPLQIAAPPAAQAPASPAPPAPGSTGSTRGPTPQAVLPATAAATAAPAAAASFNRGTRPEAMDLDQGAGRERCGDASAEGRGVAGASGGAALATMVPTAQAAGHTAARKPLGSVVEVAVQRFQIVSAPSEVKALHQRLEALLLFTIDGANFIDDEDPQWELLLPVAQAEDGGCVVMGLATLFNFYAHPSCCRLRVSQVLVLSPWQGLGLGKALLDVSYNLARRRNCTDLTVEDPTPNLQRVREKLEVEMLRRLSWVTEQAEKCLEAVARGETSWLAWSPPSEQQQKPAPARNAEPAVSAAAAAAAAIETADGAAGAIAGGGSGNGVDVSQHPLLAFHGFFAALEAVPPTGKALPADVAAEAEARWLETKRTAASAASGAATCTDTTAASGAEDAAAAAATSSAGGVVVAVAAAGGSAAGGDSPQSSDALVPSAIFVSAVSRELKMHPGQVRVVWEALLWCTPGALQKRGVRAAIEQLVFRRLESLHFTSVGRAAAAKRLVDTPRATTNAAGGGDNDGDGDLVDFFMYRPAGRPPSAGGANAANDAGGAIATGRLNLTQVTVTDKARRMAEMMTERRQQLESLAAALSRCRGSAGAMAASGGASIAASVPA